jgi:hypothetical protein
MHRTRPTGRIPVTLNASPRLTLADALRDHLGLTGTHLGCEHGICGMCTVLVNGQAARSCLLFACQLEGTQILTVEGLGRPGTCTRCSGPSAAITRCSAASAPRDSCSAPTTCSAANPG